MGDSVCPRCGRRHEEPELVLCAACRGRMMEGAQGGDGTVTTVQVGPLVAVVAWPVVRLLGR